MYNQSTSRLPGKKHKDDLKPHISDFPILKEQKSLYNPTLSPNDQARMDLMLQSMNKEAFQKEYCYKNCLRLSNTRYIEFCLQKKCNASLKEAFGALDLLK